MPDDIDEDRALVDGEEEGELINVKDLDFQKNRNHIDLACNTSSPY